MDRFHVALIALLLVVGGGLAWMGTRPQPVVTDRAAVAAIVDEALKAQTVAATDPAVVTAIVDERLAEQPKPLDGDAVRVLIEATLAERESWALPHSAATLDADTINPMIENYLLTNPSILQRASEALELEIRTAEAAEAKAAIESMQTQIYDDPDHIVLGNPNGDVTLVEMFDYNCGYCRSALPDLATLMAEDPNLKIVLKEFPILSQESVDAARVAVLVGQSDADYWTFHEKLFTSRGQVTGETALQAAQEIGLNRVNLALEMGTPKVTAIIDKSYELARALKVSGTPTYIIGDELIPGAIGIDGLRMRIANMRACGSTVCAPAEPG